MQAHHSRVFRFARDRASLTIPNATFEPKHSLEEANAVSYALLLRMRLVPSDPPIRREIEMPITAKLRALGAFINTLDIWATTTTWEFEVLGSRSNGGRARLSDIFSAGVTRFRCIPNGPGALYMSIQVCAKVPMRRDLRYPRITTNNLMICGSIPFSSHPTETTANRP